MWRAHSRRTAECATRGQQAGEMVVLCDGLGRRGGERERGEGEGREQDSEKKAEARRRGRG